jgi:hypothetical protein
VRRRELRDSRNSPARKIGGFVNEISRATVVNFVEVQRRLSPVGTFSAVKFHASKVLYGLLLAQPQPMM